MATSASGSLRGSFFTSRSFVVVFAAVAIASVVVGNREEATAVGVGNSMVATSIDQPLVHIDDRDLELGESWVSSKLSCNADIRSLSSHPIQIHRVVPSCGCTVVELASQTLSAHGSSTMSLKIDTRRITTVNDGDSPVLFAVHVDVHASAGGATSSRVQRFTFRGNVRNAVTANPPRVALPLRSVRDKRAVEQLVRLHFNVPISDVFARPSNDLVSAVLSPAGTPQDFDLLVTAPAAPIGSHSAQIKVGGLQSDGRPLPPIEITVSSPIGTDVQSSARTLVLGSGVAGTRLARDVTICSLTSSPFQVIDCNMSSDDFAAQVAELESGGGFRVTVTHVVGKSPVLQSSSLHIQARHDDGATEEIDIPITAICVKIPSKRTPPDRDVEPSDSRLENSSAAIRAQIGTIQ